MRKLIKYNNEVFYSSIYIFMVLIVSKTGKLSINVQDILHIIKLYNYLHLREIILAKYSQ